MRNAPNFRVEKYRIREGELGSDISHRNNGVFIITMRCVQVGYVAKDVRVTLHVIISDEDLWDHISVKIDVNPPRLPTWDEMCYIKNLFFQEEETVVQFHPKKSEYVNCHEYVLHLFRDQTQEHKLPPSEMIGPKVNKV